MGKEQSEELSHEGIQALHKRWLFDYAQTFTGAINQYAASCYDWFKHQGFWPHWDFRFSRPGDTVTISVDEYKLLKKCEKIALMHSELSEMLEGVRNRIPEGEKGCESEELADTLVRMLDYAGGFNLPLAQAYLNKMEKNFERPHRHGKAF